MRTNLVDGTIFGVGISGIVLIVRWLFHDAQIMEQLGMIGLGAILLIAVQIFVDRRRTKPSQPVETPQFSAEADVALEQPAPLVTPPSPWTSEADGAREQPPAEDAVEESLDPAASVSASIPDRVMSSAQQYGYEEQPDSASRTGDTPEKMV